MTELEEPERKRDMLSSQLSMLIWFRPRRLWLDPDAYIGHGLNHDADFLGLVVWNIFIFPYLGNNSSQLTNIFQRGWNHQPVPNDINVDIYIYTYIPGDHGAEFYGLW